MKLDKKKRLAAKVLNVGVKRIILMGDRLDEIKEAITKQDIKDLYKSGAINIREIKGRKKIKKRKNKRKVGKIKKKINMRKQEYVKITRKLRAYIKELKNQERLTKEEYGDLRKKICIRDFKSKAQLKEFLQNE